MFLHSVTLPSAHSARVGADYIPSQHRPIGTVRVVRHWHRRSLFQCGANVLYDVNAQTECAF